MHWKGLKDLFFEQLKRVRLVRSSDLNVHLTGIRLKTMNVWRCSQRTCLSLSLAAYYEKIRQSSDIVLSVSLEVARSTSFVVLITGSLKCK